MQGNIAEENHYYAYGLKIAGISSKKLGDSYEGSLKNNYLYQGAYSELDDDIGWTDFFLRNYDAQIFYLTCYYTTDLRRDCGILHNTA